jgi:hypothetical protein
LPHFFVWYRVKQEDRETETVIRSMMGRLACRSGSAGRLMKKRGQPQLWMETYTDVADADRFEHLLAQAVDEFDVEMFLDGGRQTECFFDAADESATLCAPCSPALSKPNC